MFCREGKTDEGLSLLLLFASEETAKTDFNDVCEANVIFFFQP